MGLDVIDDMPKVTLAVVVATVGLLAAWVAGDRRGRVPGAVRRAFRRSPWPGRGLVVLLALLLLAVVVEDVVQREHHETVLQLDRAAREAVRTAGSWGSVRTGAALMSWLTGPGLIVAVGLSAGGLPPAPPGPGGRVVGGGAGRARAASAGV